jgi:hypothetical protein
MKKLINLTIAVIICIFAGISGLRAATVNFNHVKFDTTVDPKKNPGPIDLNSHPEVMAKVQEEIKNGKIAFQIKQEGTDTTLDLSKHPELVRAIIKNPANWPIILKAYNTGNDTLTAQGRNKQVIRDIMAELIRKGIIKQRSDITSFLLTDKAFTLNGEQLPESLHQQLKAKYIKAPDYVVYYGNSEMKGKGIFQRADNL